MATPLPCLIAHVISGALRQVGGSRAGSLCATGGTGEILNESGYFYLLRAWQAVCSVVFEG
jgi:hypothetical protein